MAYNGAGVFVRIYNWTNDANASININSGRMDTEDTGFAAGLTNCICKDGQTTITANLPMATFRHTGVGNGVNRTDYAAVGQQQDGKFVYLGTTGGAADVQTAAGTPTLSAYAAGQVFRFIAGFTNATTTPTLNIDALGAKTIQKLSSALAAGDITTGNPYEVMYDGTVFQVLSLIPSIGASDATLSTTDITTNNVSTSKHGFAPKAPNDATKYLDGTAAYSVPPVTTDATMTTTDVTTNNSSTSKHGFLKKLDNTATHYMDGTGNWSAPGGSEVVLLGTATASTSATLDFTSMISASYSQYILVINALLNSANATINIAESSNNGSTWVIPNQYQTASITLGGSTAPSFAGSTTTTSGSPISTSGAASFWGHATFEVSTTNVLGFIWESLVDRDSANPIKAYISAPAPAGGVNAIRLLPSAGNFTSGSVYLYGVKNT